MGTRSTPQNSQIYAVDFGTGTALAVHGPDGPVPKKELQLPRVAGGKTPRDEFRLIFKALLERGDVVVESPTVKSSGCEEQDVVEALAGSENRLFTLSARAVKNFRKDHDLDWEKGTRYARDGATPPVVMELKEQAEVHGRDAEILYRIAVEQPYRLRVWHRAVEIQRMHTSVRPMDKRGYRDERSDEYMYLLPMFPALPPELRDVLGVAGADYSRSLVMPFAMALTEPWLNEGGPSERRGRFEKILGLYDHGYPSFYRRMTIAWMQQNAKRLAGVTRMEEVPPSVRKEAWKVTQRQIRWLFHLASR